MLDVKSWDGSWLRWKAVYSVSGQERMKCPLYQYHSPASQGYGKEHQCNCMALFTLLGKAADVYSEYSEVQMGKIMN